VHIACTKIRKQPSLSSLLPRTATRFHGLELWPSFLARASTSTRARAKTVSSHWGKNPILVPVKATRTTTRKPHSSLFVRLAAALPGLLVLGKLIRLSTSEQTSNIVTISSRLLRSIRGLSTAHKHFVGFWPACESGIRAVTFVYSDRFFPALLSFHLYFPHPLGFHIPMTHIVLVCPDNSLSIR